MRGRTLGYPTANLVPDPALVCPAFGVYACRATIEVDGTWTPWPAATSVGVRPTFVTGHGVLAEAFLLGFEGDLYGRELRLSFLERLRGEERFESVDDLVAQMARDVEETRRMTA
jgi:riboflavin kinase/FMN adenylyltransferase